MEADVAPSKCAFYECFECKEPFFGGVVDCERDLNLAETTKREDLVCKACTLKKFGSGQGTCKLHGDFFITWKCCKCCSEALFKCGPMYFCDDCHEGGEGEGDCGGVDCPLGVPHPPASNNSMKSMYPLGCSLCRNVKMIQGEGQDVHGAIEQIDLDEDEYKNYIVDTTGFKAYNPLLNKFTVL